MKSPQINPNFKLILGNAEAELKKLGKESVHAIITDPPYGYGMQDVDAQAMMQFILGGGVGTPPKKVKSGINGNKWDSMVPMQPIWSGCYDALKEGGYLAVFGTPATFKYLDMAVALSGFKIKTYAVWAYATGWPKVKAQHMFLKKLGATKKELKLYGHLRAGLCPTIELVLIAQKPFKGSVAKNLLVNGTGAMNAKYINGDRYAKNLITDGSQLIQEVLGTSIKASTICEFDAHDFAPISLLMGHAKPQDKEKKFLLEDFISSFKSKVVKNKKGAIKEEPTDKHNFHPTVKPLSLMGHLIRLFSTEGQTILDPFMGSGTTGVACHINNRNFIGIEAEKKYFEICEHRMSEIERIIGEPSLEAMEFISKARGDQAIHETFKILNKKLNNGTIKNDELIYLSEIRSHLRKMNSEKKAA